MNFFFIFRSMNQSGGIPQAIKIQAIQTNPQTGVKQIVAIPIQVEKIFEALWNQTYLIVLSTCCLPFVHMSEQKICKWKFVVPLILSIGTAKGLNNCFCPPSILGEKINICDISFSVRHRLESQRESHEGDKDARLHRRWDTICTGCDHVLCRLIEQDWRDSSRSQSGQTCTCPCRVKLSTAAAATILSDQSVAGKCCFKI